MHQCWGCRCWPLCLDKRQKDFYRGPPAAVLTGCGPSLGVKRCWLISVVVLTLPGVQVWLCLSATQQSWNYAPESHHRGSLGSLRGLVRYLPKRDEDAFPSQSGNVRKPDSRDLGSRGAHLSGNRGWCPGVVKALRCRSAPTQPLMCRSTAGVVRSHRVSGDA